MEYLPIAYVNGVILNLAAQSCFNKGLQAVHKSNMSQMCVMNTLRYTLRSKASFEV